jgi:hypothetical protein
VVHAGSRCVPLTRGLDSPALDVAHLFIPVNSTTSLPVYFLFETDDLGSYLIR